MIRLEYAGVPARGYLSGDRRYLTVHLDRDPGTGSMTLTRVSPTTVRVTGGDLEDVDAVHAAYLEAARYLTPGPGRDRHLSEAARLADLMDGR